MGWGQVSDVSGKDIGLAAENERLRAEVVRLQTRLDKADRTCPSCDSPSPVVRLLVERPCNHDWHSPIPTTETVSDVLGEGWDHAWPTGMDLVTSWEAQPSKHDRLKSCEGCGEDVMRQGITSLAYYYQTCTCTALEYPHLLERICHLRCMSNRSPDLAAQTMLDSAAHGLAQYVRGQGLADQIRQFLADRTQTLGPSDV